MSSQFRISDNVGVTTMHAGYRHCCRLPCNGAQHLTITTDRQTDAVKALYELSEWEGGHICFLCKRIRLFWRDERRIASQETSFCGSKVAKHVDCTLWLDALLSLCQNAQKPSCNSKFWWLRLDLIKYRYTPHFARQTGHGFVKAQLHWFLTPSPAALHPEADPQVRPGHETGWASTSVRLVSKGDKSIPFAANQTRIPRWSSP
jgi:hypothetical protein